MGLDDIEAAANLVQEAAHPDANIIFGASFDNEMQDEIRVTVIATGFEEAAAPAPKQSVFKPAVPKSESAAPIVPDMPKTAQPAKQAKEPAAQPTPPSGEEDPFDSIFKIFNSK